VIDGYGVAEAFRQSGEFQVGRMTHMHFPRRLSMNWQAACQTARGTLSPCCRPIRFGGGTVFFEGQVIIRGHELRPRRVRSGK
jgi:hypothetical protein